VRLIIALVIVLIAVVMYFSRTSVNPVTGEKQRVAMNVDQEIALGIQTAPKMAEQMGGVIDPRIDAHAALVSEVGQKLVAASDASKSPYASNFNFHLLADPKTVNAFALPGGQIFITRALVDRMQNEAQLAGVLGHEIGHVINRHAAEHMATGQFGQMIAVAVGVGADDSRAMAIANIANQMIQLKYSRADELESDNYGLKYMVQAGYDPSAMLDVMKILAEASGGGGRGPDFMATHPHPEARIEEIKAFLQKNYPNGVPKELTRGRALNDAVMSEE
jgi:predicted Zn-dependent protease